MEIIVNIALGFISMLVVIMVPVVGWIFKTIIDLKVLVSHLDKENSRHNDEMTSVNKKLYAIIKAFNIPYEEDDK